MSAVLQDSPPTAADSEVIDYAEISNGKVLVSYSRTEAALADLATKYKGAKYDLTTVAGDKAARSARQDLVTLRTSLEKRRKELKAPALEFGKLIDSEAKRLTDSILALEAPIDQQIRDDEARREKIRAEKAAAEAARVQRHRDGIAKIRGYVDAARAAGMTAERVLKGISALEAMQFDPALWEEFSVEAVQAKAQAITALMQIHADLKAAEEQAARLAQQAKEQAEREAELRRIAEEQAAAARALAEKEAELQRQQAAIEAQQRAAAEAAAQRQKDEQDREDARRRALAMEAQAARPAAPIPMQVAPAVVHPSSQPPADGQVVDLLTGEVHVIPKQVEPATLRLGDVCARLGFTISAGFVHDVLEIEPAETAGRAVLFRESQWPLICRALIRHLDEISQAVEA